VGLSVVAKTEPKINGDHNGEKGHPDNIGLA
jgi:hypothetical protein